MCAICYLKISIENEVSIDSCEHQFCGPCIDKWVKDYSNKCPLCRQRITKIFGRDYLGQSTVKDVQDRNLPIQREEFNFGNITIEIRGQIIEIEPEFRPSIQLSDLLGAGLSLAGVIASGLWLWYGLQ